MRRMSVRSCWAVLPSAVLATAFVPLACTSNNGTPPTMVGGLNTAGASGSATLPPAGGGGGGGIGTTTGMGGTVSGASGSMNGVAGASAGQSGMSGNTNGGSGGLGSGGGSAGMDAIAGSTNGGMPGVGGAAGSAGDGGGGSATAGNGSGGTGAGFDRLAHCDGGPYDAPFTGSVTATAITGSEGSNEDGFQIVEGPVWLAGSVYYSHITAATGNPSVLRKFTPPSTFEDFIPSSGSNGLAIDVDGNLLAATHDQQSLSKYDVATKMRSTVVGDVGGAKFNSPNDVAVHSNGTIYFTDPNWQNEGRTSVGDKRLYVVQAGVATPVETPFNPGGDGGPNGVALSLDESLLYVSGNGAQPGQIAVFAVNADGTLGDYTAFPPGADYVADGDGMTLDCAGNLYVSQGGNFQVYAPDGSDLGIITVGDSTNAAFGGADGRTLYITSFAQGKAGLHSIELAVPGLPY